MSAMLFFLFSLLALIFSSYFITSLFKDDKPSVNRLYFILVLISLVIISFQGLSLFRMITATNVQLLNFIFFIGAAMLWLKFNRPKLYLFDKNTLQSIFESMKEDKALFLLVLGLIFSSVVTLYVAFSVRTNIDDDLAYHLPRIYQWMQNQSLAHFQTNEVRHVQFPVNSELLYMWSIIQLKSDILIKLVNYASYIVSLFVLYAFLGLVNATVKQKLWAICMLGSLPLFIIEASSLQTNLPVGTVAFIAVYLLFYGVLTNKKTPLVFSALSTAIGFGIKTTMFFLMPSITLAFVLIAYKKKQKDFYKPLLIYASAFLVSFVFVSLSSYVMNYFDFGNPMGFEPFVSVHRHTSFKIFCADLIRYLTSMIDFTGMKQAQILSPYIIYVKDKLIDFINVPFNQSVMFSADVYKINTVVHEQRSLFGVLGFLVLIPYSIRSIWQLLLKKNTEFFAINLCGMTFVFYLLMLCASMKYNIDMNRYLLAAAIVSSPVFVFTYFEKLKPAKIFLVLIMMFNFLFVSTNVVSRPFFEIIKRQKENGFKNTYSDWVYTYSDNVNFYRPEKQLVSEVNKIVPENSTIGLFVDFDANLYPLYLTNKNYKIIINDVFTDKKVILKSDYLITNPKSQSLSLYKLYKNLPSNCRYKYANLELNYILECDIDKSFLNAGFEQIKSIKDGHKSKYFIYRKKSL